MITGLHIEPTNKCTLKCSRCSRTEFIEKFPGSWRNKDLNLDDFKKFFDVENMFITLSGNYGDPIYYPDLIDFVKFLKDKKCAVSIHTNGSYQTKEFWNQLGSVLGSTDRVVFAIDGLPENFTTYRVNADWTSIKLGIDTLRDLPCKIIWQYILFSYNEDNVEQAQELSQQLGFDEFSVIQSSRFNHSEDPLVPTKGRDTISVSKLNWQKDNKVEIDPVCKHTPRQHYISAEGYYTPCCWSAEHRFFYKSTFWKNKDLYNIKNTTLTKLLSHETTINFYNSIETDRPEYCTFSCPKI